MAYTASKLIEIATAEIGYHEKASNSNDDSTADHTGIVVRVTDSLVKTVEGNSGNIMDDRLLEEE